MNLISAELSVILLIVLALPFSVRKVEENLEIFLFVMGCITLSLTSQWNRTIILEALVEPIKITVAVLFAGILFRLIQKPLAHNINNIVKAIGIKAFVFIVIVGLGLSSSIITAIVASLILVEIISHLKLDRKIELKIVVFTCFSIGIGAAMTPIGEPLSTIVIAKLKGDPFQADFFFLARHLGGYIISAVLALGLAGTLLVTSSHYKKASALHEDRRENIKDIFIRTAKVYLFVMALIFLGSGFKPFVDMFVSNISYRGLYWINMTSAILDNATLAAAEIGPSMSILQIKAALLGLLIAGGMLIPGNIPNIISAGKLRIKSLEWARIGVPLGLIFMVIYFLLL